MPPSDHIVWKIVRQAVVGALLVAMLKFNYSNGFTLQDVGTIAVILTGLGSFDAAKALVVPKRKPDEGSAG